MSKSIQSVKHPLLNKFTISQHQNTPRMAKVFQLLEISSPEISKNQSFSASFPIENINYVGYSVTILETTCFFSILEGKASKPIRFRYSVHFYFGRKRNIETKDFNIGFVFLSKTQFTSCITSKIRI